MTFLQGALDDRKKWTAVGECAIEKTMYGLGNPRGPTSARLAELVDLGLLARRPYREPGQRSRDEYVLTDAGIDFMPVIWSMFEWGRHHLPGRNRLRLIHQGCGAEASVEIRCAGGHLVSPPELGMPGVKP